MRSFLIIKRLFIGGTYRFSQVWEILETKVYPAAPDSVRYAVWTRPGGSDICDTPAYEIVSSRPKPEPGVVEYCLADTPQEAVAQHIDMFL